MLVVVAEQTDWVAQSLQQKAQHLHWVKVVAAQYGRYYELDSQRRLRMVEQNRQLTPHLKLLKGSADSASDEPLTLIQKYWFVAAVGTRSRTFADEVVET